MQSVVQRLDRTFFSLKWLSLVPLTYECCKTTLCQLLLTCTGWKSVLFSVGGCASTLPHWREKFVPCHFPWGVDRTKGKCGVSIWISIFNAHGFSAKHSLLWRVHHKIMNTSERGTRHCKCLCCHFTSNNTICNSLCYTSLSTMHWRCWKLFWTFVTLR